MTYNQDEGPDPIVRVHLAGSDIPMSAERSPRRRRRGLIPNTWVLTSDDPIKRILPQAEHRCEAWVQAIDQDITVHTSLADAKAGVGGITIPQFNRAPYPLHTHDPLWAKAAVLPATVCVLQVIEGP